MKKIDNSYQKTDGIREPELKQKLAIVNSLPIPFGIKSKIPLQYTKQEGIKDVPAFLVIFSGGEKRERDYFSLIEKNENIFRRIKIEFLDKSKCEIPNENPRLAIKANEGGLSPDKLWLFSQYWINERYIKEEGKDIELIDSIYLLSDVDHFIEELQHIRSLCEKATIYRNSNSL